VRVWDPGSSVVVEAGGAQIFPGQYRNVVAVYCRKENESAAFGDVFFCTRFRHASFAKLKQGVSSVKKSGQ